MFGLFKNKKKRQEQPATKSTSRSDYDVYSKTELMAISAAFQAKQAALPESDRPQYVSLFLENDSLRHTWADFHISQLEKVADAPSLAVQRIKLRAEILQQIEDSQLAQQFFSDDLTDDDKRVLAQQLSDEDIDDEYIGVQAQIAYTSEYNILCLRRVAITLFDDAEAGGWVEGYAQAYSVYVKYLTRAMIAKAKGEESEEEGMLPSIKELMTSSRDKILNP